MTRRGPVRGGVGSGDSLNFQPQRPRWPTSTVLNYLIFLPLPVSRFYNFVPVPFSKWLISHNMGCVVSCNLLYHEFMLVFIYGAAVIFSCCGLIELLSTHWMFCPTACPQLYWPIYLIGGSSTLTIIYGFLLISLIPIIYTVLICPKKKKSIFVLLPIWLDLNQDFIF